MTNETIAQRLMQYARELEAEGSNVYRTRAYRTAARQIQEMSRPLAEVLAQQGRAGLEELPGVGKSLAYTLEALVREGQLKTLKPVDGAREPERLFASLPGVGPRLAEELRDRLGLRTLDDLARAARQGQLAQVGVGPKRLQGLLAALAQRQACAAPPANEPTVEELLEVDRAYRIGMEQESLPRLAPRQFNLEGERWLGVLREHRGEWQMRALFSNTALAHRLEKTHDWVVVYFEKAGVGGQRTVVTETSGEMAGQRVVRGRERECRQQYEVAGMTSEPAA